MEHSEKSQRKQTTHKRGCPAHVEVEPQDRQGALSDPLAFSKRETGNRVTGDTSNLIEGILKRDNMIKAYKKVLENKGSHGVDGMRVDELRGFLIKNWQLIKQKLLEGTYTPSPVRRVKIPKPDGGLRCLGIPTVLDRLIQQAIAQKLTEIYDPTFSGNSFGFRPNKSAHDAIEKSKEYINQGYVWVVDLDLEKFFDRVNHDILMGRLSRKIKDKRLLKLIRRYLTSGVMINGIKIVSEEGTPQGGPLSPLLANILLDELDKELEKRGHRFCCYADDCNVYVKSKKAGLRVMASIKELLENKLKLTINQKKSAVDKVYKRKFLGFSFYFNKGRAHIRIHEKSYKRFKDKIREFTNRNIGISTEYRLKRLNDYTVGWINYYKIANAKSKLNKIDRWIRRRLRACIWKQWKKIKTRCKNLIKLGIDIWKAWEFANTRKDYWRISNSPILARTLTNDYLENLGYKSIYKRYCLVH